MRLSIVVNTFDREPHLRRLLASLNQVRRGTFEVVVVNGPSSDGTAALLERYSDRIKVVDCPGRNLSQSRNLGIAAAAGDVVAFIDDDALPADDSWVQRYLDVFEADRAGAVGAAGGAVWHRDSSWKEFDGGLTSDYGFQIFSRSEAAPSPAGRWWPRVQGCNCAFRRTALVSVGGFDEFFAYYHDETDLCVRLAVAGFETVALPENAVRHYAASSERRTTKYDRNWDVIARSDTYYALKNGADPLPARLLRTVLYATRKHYFREIKDYFTNGEITATHWAKLLLQWARGALGGLIAGLRPGRRTADLSQAPPPFLPFTRPRPEPRWRLALACTAMPDAPHASAADRRLHELALAMHEHGHEVHLIAEGGSPVVHRSPGLTHHGARARPAIGMGSGIDSHEVHQLLARSLGVADTVKSLHAQGTELDCIVGAPQGLASLALVRAQVVPTCLVWSCPAGASGDATTRIPSRLELVSALERYQLQRSTSLLVAPPDTLAALTEFLGQAPLPSAFEDWEAAVAHACMRDGAACATRRRGAWPRDIDLLDPEATAREGRWEVKEVDERQYLVAQEAGASLAFEVPAGVLLDLAFLRHSWSGVVEVELDGRRTRVVDLYRPGPAQHEYVVECATPASDSARVRVRVAVSRVRNPASHAAQVWLRRIAVTPADGARRAS